jgi:hypothetical protein
MNELQIKITADLKDALAAINKFKQTLKQFEAETSKERGKSNQQQEETVGLIERQIQKAKELKISLSKATNEQEIAGFNAELEQTNQELARLNSLGKSFGGTAVKSFDNLKRSAGAASGAAISFGRIIQDAPFGIIGVANNIQNFGEQFVALGDKSTTAAGKLKLFFSALITPSNLAILAVSALTAAWQAYQLGAFDALFATESLSKKLKEISDNTKSATANASVELTKLESLKNIIEDETVSRDKRLKAVNRLIEIYPALFSLADKEKLLNGQLVKSYEVLTEAIIAKAKASIAEQELPELVKQKEIVDSTLKSKQALLAVEEARLKTASRLTPIEDTFKGSEFEQISRIIKPLKADVEELSLRQKELKINIDGYTQSITSFTGEYQNLLEPLKNNDEAINRTTENLSLLTDSLTILREQQKNFFGEDTAKFFRSFDPQAIVGPVQGASMIYTENVEAMIQKNKEFEEALNSIGLTSAQVFQAIANGAAEGYSSFNEFITDLATTQQFFNEAFAVLEAGIENTIGDVAFSIGEALGSGGDALKSGGGALLGGMAAILNQLGQLAIQAGITIEATKQSLKTLNGPIAIAAGVAMIALAGYLSSQSRALSGKFGGGGGSPSGGQGSTFTNRREFGGPVSKGRAYIVGERRPELFVPNTNGIIVPQLPSMDYSGTSMSAGAMAIDVNIQGVSYGDDILFTVQQAQIRRNIR